MAPRDVIDSTAEALSLHPEHLAFSPVTFKKRWTKAAIIELYNSSKGPGRPEYPTTSLGNKAWRRWLRTSSTYSLRPKVAHWVLSAILVAKKADAPPSCG